MKELLLPIFLNSLNEKKGLMFFLNGQSMPGVVRKIDDNLVEVYNQQYDHIFIVIDQIDAIGHN